MTTAAQFETMRAEWLTAVNGDKTAVVVRWAKALGVSPATLYRRLRAAGHRGPERTREPDRPEYREWARTLLDLMARHPAGSIPLRLCLQAAAYPDPITGELLLPPEALRVPEATYQRIIRDELGGRQRQRRNRRLHAEHPNQAWLIDATTSMHLTVVRPLDDGDFLLRLWRSPAPSSYKNKPLGEHRLRLLYYGIWDMATGYQAIKAQVARGESGLDAMGALCHFMERRDDPRDPLHGVPEDLWSDQGVLTKHASTRDLLDRLGIHLVLGDAYAKTRMGGVEQMWRRQWQSLEGSLFLAAPLAGRFELPLSQFEARLAEYLAEVNARPSRADPKLSRRDAWVRGINQRGGARLCPERPLETLAQEVRRWVDGSGVFRWDNQEYEVPRLHRTWVLARRALDGSGRVIVEHEESGRRYDCTPFQPIPYGEFRGKEPRLPIEQARARAEVCPILPGDPYAPNPATSPDLTTAAGAGSPSQGANVVTGRFGPRSQPAAPLDDPLEAACYASLSQAMAAFSELFGARLSADNRALVEQSLLQSGLRKTVVAELAALLSIALTTTGVRA